MHLGAEYSLAAWGFDDGCNTRRDARRSSDGETRALEIVFSDGGVHRKAPAPLPRTSV